MKPGKSVRPPADQAAPHKPASMALPGVMKATGHSLQSALSQRRSIRSFSQRALTWAEISQLLWAAQGISEPHAGLRAAPSAGALYPLELDVVIPPGVFRYQTQEHRLVSRLTGDIRPAIAQAAHAQTWLVDAPCLLSFAAVMRRTAAKYGARASRFVHLETGHAAQNVLLTATALGLGATPVGAFDDNALARVLGLERSTAPIYIVAVGWPAE